MECRMRAKATARGTPKQHELRRDSNTGISAVRSIQSAEKNEFPCRHHIAFVLVERMANHGPHTGRSQWGDGFYVDR